MVEISRGIIIKAPGNNVSSTQPEAGLYPTNWWLRDDFGGNRQSERQEIRRGQSFSQHISSQKSYSWRICLVPRRRREQFRTRYKCDFWDPRLASETFRSSTPRLLLFGRSVIEEFPPSVGDRRWPRATLVGVPSATAISVGSARACAHGPPV